MPSPLTSRQEQLLRYIETCITEWGHPPTLYEMAQMMGGITVRAVKDHLNALEKKGYLSRPPGKRRAIGLLQNRSQQVEGIPIVGRVAAGIPILSVENMEGILPIKPERLGKANYFALRVRGDSMIGAGINEGDHVIVQQQETARNGDIVVALLGDETTVKFFRISGKELFLEAANPAYPPIPFTAKAHEPKILGRVVGLYRSIP